ncbi:Alpha/Beta hydrolase protein [Mariannaea sp. PMI_226]|nr:Alpha/Beta hydrolase protein [Mariannaea sp. PMI_226]
MQFRVLSLLFAFGTLSQAAFNENALKVFSHERPQIFDRRAEFISEELPTVKERKQSRFLTKQSKKFVVNGKKIPDVPFDIGESYAGLLPISESPHETRKLYFWFFPSTNPKAGDDVLIWLNGGPGCSSLSGMLTENGPFLWQQGTLSPVPNSYSWTNLTNVIWVEQPVGVGFSQGKPNITNEAELGREFTGFWRNFIKTFELEGATTYISGESYAGYYVPYIANAFIEENDDKYFKLGGVAINDPIIGDGTLQQQAVIFPYIETWNNVLNLNDSYINALRWTHEHCNYAKYLEKYATFPPTKKFPVLPDPYHGNFTCDVFDLAYSAAVEANPCFNVYHITDMCPFTYSQLGIVNPGDYSPPGAQVYFNRTDVQDAINAPHVNWYQCTPNNVFGEGNPKSNASDTSLAPAQTDVLRRVIEHTNNTIIGVGRLDFLLPPNGTLFALQNATWHGKQGFQKYPQDNQFYVPYHPEYNGGRLSEAGIVGQWGSERGLTYYEVQLAGHELPGYTAGAGYRVIEFLLGRIKNLATVEDFTTQKGHFQGNHTLGYPVLAL